MNTYKLTILGLSEVRWNGQGEHAISSGELFLYSGKEEGSIHESGVGILMSKRARESLISWKPVNDRIIIARFYTKIRKISIIQCYAPTNDSDLEEKQNFYEQLSHTVQEVATADILIVMGDLNAKVGCDNYNLERVMGRHGLGEMNENGELLAHFCSSNNLLIGGTLFPHKRIHKITWVSPDQRTENQIDHIMISRRWRTSLLDVRNRRGADISSDHHLVTGCLRLKLSSNPCRPNALGRERYNVSKLTTTQGMRNYRQTLRNNIQTLPNRDRNWKTISDVIKETAASTIGKVNKHRKDWISDQTWELIQKRREEKGKLMQIQNPQQKLEKQEAYRELNRAVKRSARHDKRVWAEQMAEKAQIAADNHNTRELYQITKKLSNKRNNGARPIKDANGQILTSLPEQLNRWKEHFQEKLGRFLHLEEDEDEERVEEGEPVRQLPINCNAPSKTEIHTAIKALKNNKAPGVDNLPAELLKADPETCSELLQPLLKQVWESNTIPDDWKQGLIVKLPKKGDLRICDNWRGITLLNTVNKVVTQIILTRLGAHLDQKLRPNQAGFRPNSSCTDHINTVRIILEQSAEWRSPLYLLFIDFERAFDSLFQPAIWRALKQKGVPDKIITIIQEIYRNTQCYVAHGGYKSEEFEVRTGVRQGCLLSPLLFNVLLDSTLKHMNEQPGIQWTLSSNLTDLEYADDICLMSHRYNDLANLLNKLNTEAQKVGLKINITKTKSLRIQTRINTPFSLNGLPIEEVESFTYLGSILTKDGGADADVKNRIRKAQGAFGILTPVWRSTQYSTRTKLRIFNTNVKSVLLYGCETWKITKIIVNQLQVFINKCLRKILRIFWPDRITNEDLLYRSNQKNIEAELALRKWGWIGHTLRKGNNCISRMALDWNPQGKRSVGRPAQTWKRTVSQELRKMNMSWQEAKALALNRTRWRAFTEALCSAQE